MAWKFIGAFAGGDYGFKSRCASIGPRPVKVWVPVKGEKWKRHYKPSNRVASLKGYEAIRDYTESRANLYARWLAQRDGVEVPPDCYGVPVWSSVVVPNKKLPEPRVKAVEFRKRHSYRVRETEGPTLLTIAIPHWDWVPEMTEQTEMDLAA